MQTTNALCPTKMTADQRVEEIADLLSNAIIRVTSDLPVTSTDILEDNANQLDKTGK